MGTEGVKIKRAKYLEAGMKVDVHAFIRGKFLSELQTYLMSMLRDINANVNLINQGKEALLTSVRKLLAGEYIQYSHHYQDRHGRFLLDKTSTIAATLLSCAAVFYSVKSRQDISIASLTSCSGPA